MGIRHPFLRVDGGWVKPPLREEGPSLLYQTVEVIYITLLILQSMVNKVMTVFTWRKDCIF
jgi:hypothetical protein